MSRRGERAHAPRLQAVADQLGVNVDLLRDAVLSAGDGGTVWINVRRPKHDHLYVKADTRLWRAAEFLGVEPEDLRAAIIKADPKDKVGGVKIGVRR